MRSLSNGIHNKTKNLHWSFSRTGSGTFLFLLYINDLSSVSESNPLMISADDTTIINGGKRSDLFLKNDIVPISRWFEANKMTIHTDTRGADVFLAAANLIT